MTIIARIGRNTMVIAAVEDFEVQTPARIQVYSAAPARIAPSTPLPRERTTTLLSPDLGMR
jgi:hypothetical protein